MRLTWHHIVYYDQVIFFLLSGANLVLLSPVFYTEELAALFTYVVVRKEREIQICNTNEEDRETSQIIPSPKLPVCLVRFNSRPRLSKFGLLDLSIESSDGGAFLKCVSS